MEDGVTFDTTRIEQAFALVAHYSVQSEEKEFRTTCRGIVNIWISITPPSTGRGVDERNNAVFDVTAQIRGVSAIKRDLLGGGKSKTSSSRAGLFNPLSDSLIDSALDSGLYQTENVRLFVKKDGTVYGTDRTHFLPDAGVGEMRSLHKAAFKNGRMSSAGSTPFDRMAGPIGRWKFIDKYVIRHSAFDGYMSGIINKVGWLASSLNDIARLTGARVPGYARGKNAPSFAALELSSERLHFKYVNLIAWAGQAADGELGRRFNAALEYQANAMFRRIPFLIAAASKRAGFNVS